MWFSGTKKYAGNDRIRENPIKIQTRGAEEKLEKLVACFPNTAEQEAAFDKIKSAIADNKRLLIFIQGSAGTGKKTTFAKKEPLM